ncbi:MAG TPA: hypothetical protein PKY30_16040 [Myxococcota bacterium]|nr:hypothetical protein [Myxococcota bacterium]HNH48553.1 hypothetical protein [Myxococcota bacterium]
MENPGRWWEEELQRRATALRAQRLRLQLQGVGLALFSVLLFVLSMELTPALQGWISDSVWKLGQLALVLSGAAGLGQWWEEGAEDDLQERLDSTLRRDGFSPGDYAGCPDARRQVVEWLREQLRADLSWWLAEDVELPWRQIRMSLAMDLHREDAATQQKTGGLSLGLMVLAGGVVLLLLSALLAWLGGWSLLLLVLAAVFLLPRFL